MRDADKKGARRRPRERKVEEFDAPGHFCGDDHCRAAAVNIAELNRLRMQAEVGALFSNGRVRWGLA